MTVLFIDPGTVQSAFVHWDGKQLGEKAIWPNESVLQFLRHEAECDQCAIEAVASYGMPVGREVFETCIWIGRFVEVLSQVGKPPQLIFRRDIKLHHCASVTAKDSNIRQALIDRFGSPGVKANPGVTYGLKKDLWAAFAGATCVWDLAVGDSERSSSHS